MCDPPDVIGTFYNRIRRQVRDAITRYDQELGAISADMAARGLFNSGANLKQRIKLLQSSMHDLTDRCLEDVTRLPGDQQMHRMVHEEFLKEQLGEFFKKASAKVLFPNAPSPAIREIESQQTKILAGMHHDLQDFKANLWQPRNRPQGGSPSVTNNTVNIHGSNMGSIQQAGEGSTQQSTVNFNAGAISVALEDFISALQTSDVETHIKDAAMAEVETIRPQLKKSQPNTNIVKEALHSLRNVLEGVAAGVLSAKLLALMVAAGISM